MSFLPLFALGAAAMALMMAAVWGMAIRIRNAGIVDVAWAAGFSPLAVLFAALGPGYLPRRLLIAAMAIAWSLRLAVYLCVRVMGHHPVEDGRYQQLRREWAPHVNRRLFWFFQFQGALNALLAVPVLVACLNPVPRVHPLEWCALGLWGVALAGEATADRQLQRFKADPVHQGQVCQVGLWRYSRHPNYFFEWLVWCAFFLFALASPWGLVTLYCPVLMLYFLFEVTGIPMTEEQAERSKGEAYREYRRTTSVFLPWVRRKG